MLTELKVLQTHVPVLFTHNISAKYLKANPAMHACIKYVKIYFHFIRDIVIQDLLDVKFTPFEDQVTSVLTKSLLELRFSSLKIKLMIVP